MREGVVCGDQKGDAFTGETRGSLEIRVRGGRPRGGWPRGGWPRGGWPRRSRVYIRYVYLVACKEAEEAVQEGLGALCIEGGASPEGGDGL